MTPTTAATEAKVRSLIREFDDRNDQWRQIFVRLNGGTSYAHTRTFLPRDPSASLVSYQNEYNANMAEQSVMRCGLQYSRKFRMMFKGAQAELDQIVPAGATGTENNLGFLYGKKDGVDKKMSDLVAQMKAIDPVTQSAKPKLVSRLEKLMKNGDYEKALAKLESEKPGRMSIMTGRTKKAQINADLGMLRDLVVKHRDQKAEADTIQPYIDAVEKHTAKAIRSAMRYSLKADNLFAAGNSPIIDSMVKASSGVQLLRKYEANFFGLSQSEIIKDLRAAKGKITLDSLGKVMAVAEGQHDTAYRDVTKRFDESTTKLEQCREFFQSCRSVGKTEISMPGLMTYKTVADALTEALNKSAKGEVGEDELLGLIKRAEKRQNAWRPQTALNTLKASADIFANVAAFTPTTKVVVPDPGFLQDIFNAAARVKDSVRSAIVHRWAPF